MIADNKCPLCNSKNLSKVVHHSTFKIVECNSCKIAFTDPPPILPEYKEMDFHSKNDVKNVDNFTTVNDLHADWQKLIRLQVNMIKNNFTKESAIIEIGCGEGILLNELKENGFNIIQGFEPSKNGAARAIKKNLPVINEYFSENLVERKYDLVIMSHVFEHIQNPFEFLDKIKNILKPNGYLMLTQTNYKGLIPIIQKTNWYAWVPDEHFWHFTTKSLEKIFTKRKFKITELKYTTLIHEHNLLYKAAKIFPSLQDQYIILSKKYD